MKRIRTSPYQGLVAYSEEDEPFFFGRTQERQTISFNLRGSRLTILYGPTGVGKSSVLRAGVSTDLRRLAKDNVVNTGNAESIVVVFSSWRDDPVRGLTSRMRDSVEQIIPGAGLSEPSNSGLAATTQSYSKQLQCDFLIILDQFEEYFLYQRTQTPRSFGDQLSETLNISNLRANFLISIREDALSRLDVFKDRVPRLFDNCLRIEHLRSKAAREAIERPITVYNKMTGSEFIVESKLVYEVCRQVATKTALSNMTSSSVDDNPEDWLARDAQIEAPLLQLVMSRIWDEENRQGSHTLRVQTFETLGNAKTIVKDQLELDMKRVPDEELDISADIFHYLVTPSGWKIAHTLTDLAGYTRHPKELLEPVLNRLSSQEFRILRAVPSTLQDAFTPRFEIFHDVQAPAVLQWVSAFRQQFELKEQREELEKQRKRNQLEVEHATQRARRTTISALIMFLIVVAFVVLYAFSVRQTNKAKRAEAEALTQRTLVEKEVNYRNELELTIPYLKQVLRGHSGSISKVFLTADGRKAITAGDDKTIRLWDITSGTSVYELIHPSPIVDVAYSARGRYLASTAGNSIYIWEPETGNKKQQLASETLVRKVVFSPDERLFATTADDAVVRVWEVGNERTKYTLKGHLGAVTDLQFSSDGRLLVTTSVDHTARIWSTESGQLQSELKGHVNVVNSGSFSSDGRLVATASDDWTIRLWSTVNGRGLKVIVGHEAAVHAVEFSPRNNLIVSSSADKTAKVWDAEKQQLKSTLRGHSDDVVAAFFASDGRRVITASTDRTARVWDAGSGRLLQELRAHIREVNSAEFGPDSTMAITGSADSTARIWQVGDEGVITVTEIKVSVNPSDYSGPCPTFVRVFGRIATSGTSGQIKYRFVRQFRNGLEKPGSEKTLFFDNPGTKEVGAVHQFGGPKFPTIDGAFLLEILEPHRTRSDSARFEVKCTQVTEDPLKPIP